MPRLQESLEGKDLGHLAIVAECWGIEIKGKNAKEGIDSLSQGLLKAQLVEEIIEALPKEARDALAQVGNPGGRLEWGLFERQFGPIRALGPAKRDKEQPQRDAKSISEVLWYRALIGRAFFDTDKGPIEFAYIPSDLMALIPGISKMEDAKYGRIARPAERKIIIEVNEQILMQSVSYLAGLRMGMSEEILAQIEKWEIPLNVLRDFMLMLGGLTEDGKLRSKVIQNFLSIERGEAMQELVGKWKKNREFNELRMLPRLKAEGEWTNNAKQSRGWLIEAMRRSSNHEWWSIDAFIDDVKAKNPNFLRRGGEYESWYFKDTSNGEFLRGFENWDKVERAYIHWMISGPMHWMGIVELGYGKQDGQASAFRFSAWAKDLLDGKAIKMLKEGGKIIVDSQGQIQVPENFPRALRYQLARFCEWDGRKKNSYRYQIRSRSLEKAKAQGLEVGQLLALLQKHANSKIPPNLVKALKHWDQEGTVAKAGEMLVLRVRSGAVMKALLASRGKRYLGEILGPLAVEIKPGARRNVLQVMTELGYLAEIDKADET